MSSDSLYRMSLTLNILNHLGFNLYSNIPAVLSEVVANSWDADAESVDIVIDRPGEKIVITDDGHGMTLADINEKYLTVGYRRREEKGGATTPKHGRDVMGRKGIGKLSLFSIARTIEVRTVKDGDKRGFRMALEDIQKIIKAKGDATYHPQPVDAAVQIKKGTQIVLTNLKKVLTQTEKALRKRLARRFSIIGDRHRFSVKVNGSPIKIEDRDYFHKIQYLWRYGGDSEEYLEYCKKHENDELRDGSVPNTDYTITGWIGTVAEAGHLKDEYDDNLNKILIMVRGKLAQEDILEDFSEGGIYSKYVIGEIHADFLDIDAEEDIATTSRQKIIEDSSRYRALRAFVLKELKHIQNSWTSLRNAHGEKKALEIPAIKKWFTDLPPKTRRHAKSLFGKINQMSFGSEKERRVLFQHGVLAFENLRYKDSLDRLERISPDNLQAFAEVFQDLDDIEATLYHQIVSERIRVIEALQQKTEENALEKVIQRHLFDHLWLLDPHWERATETPYMEQTVETEFGHIDAKLSNEEKEGRLDIKYKTTSGKHIIVELKRADRKIDAPDLMKQVGKYQRALRKVLRAVGKSNEPIEVVCVVGKELTDWEDAESRKQSEDSLKAKDIRVVLYQELIESAQQSYRAYLEKRREAGRIVELLRTIEIGEL